MAKRTARDISAFLGPIVSEFPDIRTELTYSTPFQFLVAVMLSAQTTDKQVNRTTPEYFSKVRTPEDALAVSVEETERMLGSVNYYRTKCRHVRMAAEMLVRDFGSEVPRRFEDAVKLPGVGVKTAKVVLSVLYDAPLVGVDTHVHRVLNRLGIVTTASPEASDREVERVFTTEQKRYAHHPLVLFGRYRCLARNPRCSDCPLRDSCPALAKALKSGKPVA